MSFYNGIIMNTSCDISNFDLAIEKSVPENDPDKKKLLYDMYSQNIKTVKKANLAKRICTIFGLIGWVISASISPESVPGLILFLVITLPAGALLAAIILHFLFRSSKKICDELHSLLHSNETVFTFESNILDFYETEEAKIYNNRVHPYTAYHLVLENEVEILLFENAYMELQQNNTKKVKIYFYKKLLEKNVYIIEGVI